MKNKRINWTEELPKMVKMIEDGKTIRDLGVMYGVSFQCISYGFERNGLRLRNVSKTRILKRRAMKAQRQIIKDARQEIKLRDAFFEKWSDISSYKPSQRRYNEGRVLKQDKYSIDNRKRQEAYREANWMKVLARKVVAYAVKRGYLVHSICNCGCGTIGTEFHHHDYNKALDVVCMCKKAHNEIHSGDAWKTDRNMEVTHETV